MQRYFNFSLIIIVPLIAIAVVLQLYMFIPVNSLIQEIYSVNTNHASMMTSIFGIFYAFGLLFWGLLSQRITKEKLLSTGLILLFITTVLLSFDFSYKTLIILRGFQGFFASSFPPIAIMWLIEKNPSRSIMGITLASFAFVIAGGVGQYYGLLTIPYSIRLSMLILAPVYLLAAIFIALYSKITDTVPLAIKQKSKTSSYNKAVFKAYSAAPFILGSFISFHTILSSNYNGMAYLMGKLSIIESICFASSLFAVFFIKRLGAARATSLCLFIIGVTSAISMFFLISGSEYLIYSQIIFSLALGLLAPSIMTFTTKMSNGVTMVTSVYIFLLFTGASLGSFLPSLTGIYTIFIQAVSLITISLVIFYDKN